MTAAIGFLLGILLATPVAYMLGLSAGFKRTMHLLRGTQPPERPTGFPARWEGGK